MPYVAIWRYVVRPERTGEFCLAYGSDGIWCRLFRRADGYVSTQLVRDAAEPDAFLTIDTWSSREAYAAFRARFAAEYEATDRLCGELTLREERIAEGETDEDVLSDHRPPRPAVTRTGESGRPPCL